MPTLGYLTIRDGEIADGPLTVVLLIMTAVLAGLLVLAVITSRRS